MDLAYPLGAWWTFKPQKDDAKLITKGNPDTVTGVFLGYKLLPGGLGQGEFRVAALTEFADLDLLTWGRHKDVHHQVVKEVLFRPAAINFPLRAKFDYVTRTLAGAEGVPYNADPEPDSDFS